MSLIKAGNRPVLVVLGIVLSLSVADAAAQSAAERMQQRRSEREQRQQSKQAAEAQAPRYPQATRKEPDAKASSKGSATLKKIFDAYEKDDAVTVTALADQVIADAKANAYEHAIAARLAGATLLNTDNAKAKTYLQKALEFDGLSNNEHYESMYLLAQLQLQDDQYAEGLATLDRYLAETQSQKPEELALKGNALYRLERYPEAAAALKQAIAAGPEPKQEWLQLLMGVYFDMKQPAEASKLAEELIAKNPNDVRMQLNLASVYMQGDQDAKAIDILEKLRASGKLTEARDYRNLYALYLNSDKKEKEAAAVIKEGLDKGVLKADYETYNALAQAYWFSEQTGPAIEAYQKAAPLAPDGETYLNLAKALNNSGRAAEAKQAAQKALEKGVKKPEDAKRIIGNK